MSVIDTVTMAGAGTSRPPERKWWTTREIALLRKHFPAGGVKECSPLFPDRTADAIVKQARTIGLCGDYRPAKGTLSLRWYNWEPHHDEAIRRAYAEPHHSMALKRLSVHLGRGYKALRRRAIKIGVNITPMHDRKRWTTEEDGILLAGSNQGVRHLRNKLKSLSGFTRSDAAIVARIRVLGLSRQKDDDPDTFSAESVSKFMGCSGSSVRRWIECGNLPAKVCGQGKATRIRRSDLRKFLIENVGRWDHRKIDPIIVVDIIAGTKR